MASLGTRASGLHSSFIDLGYIGKAAMDDEDGETHPKLGARVMDVFGEEWAAFCLLHSRYYAKRLGRPFSRLCVADKLSFALTPRWLYLPMVNWSGEIHEYLDRAKNADQDRPGELKSRFAAADYRGRQVEWHIELCRYMRAWVEIHKNGAQDTWTSADRHARTDSGVWQ